jgi:hypothetical protein
MDAARNENDVALSGTGTLVANTVKPDGSEIAGSFSSQLALVDGGTSALSGTFDATECNPPMTFGAE